MPRTIPRKPILRASSREGQKAVNEKKMQRCLSFPARRSEQPIDVLSERKNSKRSSRDGCERQRVSIKIRCGPRASSGRIPCIRGTPVVFQFGVYCGRKYSSRPLGYKTAVSKISAPAHSHFFSLLATRPRRNCSVPPLARTKAEDLFRSV